MKATATTFSPATLFQNIFIVSGAMIVVGRIVGMLLIWKAREEVPGAEKLNIPLPATIPEIIDDVQIADEGQA